MLLVAVIFVCCAVSCPTLGQVFYLGGFRVGAEELRMFYKGYAVVMAGLFLVSFLLPKGKR